MALIVNTNIHSLNAQRNLRSISSDLALALERLSSGLRINSAKDDPAGLSVTDRMTTQVRGLTMAIRNANDGISLTQTAEGALQEVTTLLQQMRELAIQSANPTNTAAERLALQTEMNGFRDEINRISEQTEFNGIKILAGGLVNAGFQVGFRAEQTVNVSIIKTDASNIGNYSITSDGIGDSAIGAAIVGEATGEASPNLVQAQIITLRGFNSGVIPTTVTVDDGETAKSIAAKISLAEEGSGISATAKTRLTMGGIFDETPDPDTGLPAPQVVSFRLYGTNAKSATDPTNIANAVTISAEITDATKAGLQPLIDAINAQVATTGIQAAFVEEDGTIELIHATGEDISIEAYTNTAGADDNAITVIGLEDTEPVELVEGTDGDSATVGGIVTLNSSKIFSVTSDADAETSLFSQGFTDVTEGVQAATLSRLSDVNISTEAGAQSALTVMDGAIARINALRGDLGSVQNRLESTIANLDSVLENTEAARSKVLDADFAEETARLTRAQILQQSGIAILGQANLIPQQILQLLQQG